MSFRKETDRYYFHCWVNYSIWTPEFMPTKYEIGIWNTGGNSEECMPE